MIKLNTRLRWLSVAVLLVMGITVALSVGVAFGRYQTRSDYNVSFSVASKCELSFYEYSHSDNGESSIESFNGLSWEQNDHEQVSEVIISNYNAELNVTEENNVSFRVRLFVEDSSTSASSLGSVNIVLTSDEFETSAQSYYISASTPMILSSNYEQGYVYCFVDENNEEIIFNLPGKVKTDITVAFTVPHTVVTDSEGNQTYELQDLSGFELLVDMIPPQNP